MKKSRFSDEQIVRILREADQGTVAEVAKVAKKMGTGAKAARAVEFDPVSLRMRAGMAGQRWNVLVEKLRNLLEINIAVYAAAKLQSDASTDDIPRLIGLVSDPDFFVREAAAWPLADLGCVDALPALVRAQELGTKDGHDNDGLNAAILDLVSINRAQSKPKLEAMRGVNDAYARETVEWLLTFCAE